jgi:hypothetical protein
VNGAKCSARQTSRKALSSAFSFCCSASLAASSSAFSLAARRRR